MNDTQCHGSSGALVLRSPRNGPKSDGASTALIVRPPEKSVFNIAYTPESVAEGALLIT